MEKIQISEEQISRKRAKELINTILPAWNDEKVEKVIDGLSKKEFLLSKIITISLLSLISTALVFFFSS